MRLSDFIISREEEILQEWENFARTMAPAALSMSDKELRNHAVVMLRGIADDLRTPQTSEQELAKSHGQEPGSAQTLAGEQHGISRQESRFSIEQLVAEYRALRASVLRLWGRETPHADASDIADIARFNEAIDQLLAASVLSFAKATRDAMDAEKRRKDEFLAMLAPTWPRWSTTCWTCRALRGA
ncbi:MAG TPA: RsbRD N-terminal domain-containing protein [Telluria sp.]|nr:RsbRD N-terminal domain-containing protein [Telluria sp.]